VQHARQLDVANVTPPTRDQARVFATPYRRAEGGPGGTGALTDFVNLR
jgi:hypothetical protein